MNKINHENVKLNWILNWDWNEPTRESNEQYECLINLSRAVKSLTKVKNYKQLLRPLLNKNIYLKRDYDNDTLDAYLYLEQNAYLVPLFGSMSLDIVVPDGVKLEVRKGLGHSNVYKLSEENNNE